MAWTFLPKDIINLTNAPVIRKSGDYIAKLLKEQRPTEIQFPMLPKFSPFDNLVNFLEEAMEELSVMLKLYSLERSYVYSIFISIVLCIQVKMKELNLPIDDFNGWSCQVIAENDTWSHARRKRRLAQRLMKKADNQDTGNIIETNDLAKKCAEEFNENSIQSIDEQQKIEKSPEKAVAKECFLVCNFFAEVIENEESEGDDVKISMVFEKGSGGKNALETLRQYLINKLDIREYCQKQHAKPSKNRRKRLKRNESDMNSEEIGESLDNDTESA